MFKTHFTSHTRLTLVLAVALVVSLVAHVFRDGGPAIEAAERPGAARPAGFLSARIGTVMGRSTLDLRETTIAPGEEAIVTVYVAVGHVTLRVPDGWDVDASALPGITNVEDTRRPAPSAATGPSTLLGAGARPRLVLRGIVMIGTVEIAS